MNRRRREINVFSMSALDLFASAMGAFMLIALIMLPFFPNTGDSTTADADVQERLEAAEKKLAQTQAKLDELRKQRENPPQPDASQSGRKLSLPSLDIVIALDTTGSMIEVVAGLKAEITQFAQLLDKLASSVAIGVVDFKDRCEVSAVRVFDLERVTSASARRLQWFVDSISVGGSGCNRDAPEAMAAALESAVGMQWRADTTAHIIVVISDNPPYDDRLHVALGSARSFATRGSGYQVSGVFVGTGGTPGRDFLEALSKAGNGEFVSGGGSFTASILLALTNI